MQELNKEQTKAVNFKDGPCLVLAGAGSGKTKVITKRIVKLIETGVSPHNILAITFTNKAANEMKFRVHSEIGNEARKVFIGTFHSFGLKVIRENYEQLNFKNNITVIDSDDSSTIIKKILKELNKDPKQFSPRYIKNKISLAKNELMDPDEFSKVMLSPIDKVVIEVYRKYEETLKTNNSVDFDDLLLLPTLLFKKNKKILEKYEEHFKYILIDEYQDTNKVQYDLCKLLSTKYNNIFVVGDIDQSIYSFRYANYENILNFEKDYNNCTTILLEQNYRSTQNILDAANSVIKNNNLRKDKNLWSDKKKGDKIKYIRCYDERHEVTNVIDELKKEYNKGIFYSNIAILYRTNAQSRIVEEELLKENIPYKIVGSYHFYNRKEIKDLISYLKLIYNPYDGVSLTRAINAPKRGIGPKTLENIINIANEKKISMFEAIEKGKELQFKKIIVDLIERKEKLTLTELVDEVILRSGLKQSLLDEKTLESEIRIENLEEFKSITTSFEQKTGLASLEDFLESISLVSDISNYKEENDAINVMTIHSAKGLEFDVVFLIGMEENLFPHINSIDNKEELEEERRLCYVAITRARKKLFVLNTKRRMLYGRDMINAPSRFIEEIDENLIESNSLVEKTFNKDKMYKENYNDDLKTGDKIVHDKYGEGVVISVDNNIATIAFSHKIGIKTLIKTHKSLKKV